MWSGLLISLLAAGAAAAESGPAGVTLLPPVTQQWRMGVIVRAPGGPCAGLTATAPTPADWPEQRVKIIRKEISKQVREVRFRTLEGGVRQMVVQIPALRQGETASAVFTFEIARRDIRAPADPSGLRAPSRPPAEARAHLAPSPGIESNAPQIRALARRITEGKAGAWERVDAIFHWVRANIRYEFDPELKGALAALQAGKGDCEELTSLFAALCRAAGIPARSVWLPGHCYPEFYLEDPQGRGYWFPCQAAGADGRLGEMTENRPILQKGDRFRPPGARRPQRYVQPTLTARRTTAPPELQWVCEPVKEGERGGR